MLTKTQMREQIEAGGSVLYKGKLITRVDQLTRITGTDAEKQSEIDSLEARLAELKGGGTAAETPAEKTAEGSQTLDDTAAELKRHTRAELVETAQAESVEVGESDTKAEIIEKILAKRK